MIRVELSNKRRLEVALKLLRKVSEHWDNDKVMHYPTYLPSFDELVSDLECIMLKD